MPIKKSVYGDSKTAKSSKTSKTKSSGVLTKAQISMELAALKERLGKDYINKKLSNMKFASDAQMTTFIKNMKKKRTPRSAIDIQGDIDMEKERLGAGVVNNMLRNAGFLEPAEMEELLDTLKGMKTPKKTSVSKEERVNVDSVHENLVKVAETSSSEDLRSVAKQVDEELSLAQVERNKIDKINGEIRDGINTFRNMMTIKGEFDPTKNLNINLDIPTISGVLSRLNASFTELSGKQVKFAEIPFDSILGALTTSFESTKKVVEVANTYSSDLTHAVNSKSLSEMGRAVAAASFDTIENFIYGDMPRNVAETQQDYNTRLNELKKLLLQKQAQFESNTGLLTQANEKIRTLTHELEDARERISNDTGSYNKLATEYKTVQDGVALLNNELSYLRAAKNSFSNLANHFHLEFDKLAPQIEKTLVELETERNNLKNQLAEEEGKHKDEIAILKKDIEEKEGKIQYLKDMVETADDHFNQIIDENLAKYKTDLGAKDDRIEQLRSKIKAIKRDKASAEDELKKTKNQLEGLTTQIRLKNNEIERLNSDIESLRKSLSEASTADSKAKALIESYKTENTELAKKLEVETNKVIEANQLIEAQKADFLRREEAANQDHQRALDELNNTIQSIQGRHQIALKLLNSRKEKIDELTSEKATLLQQLEETERKVGELSTSSMGAEKMRQTLDTAADTIVEQQKTIDGMKFLWDGLVHPKTEFRGRPQVMDSQGELERITNLMKRWRKAYETKRMENEALQRKIQAKKEALNRIQEELTALRERSTQQHQGLNPEAKAHLQAVAEAANPNGQIAKLIEAEQSVANTSLLVIPGDIPSEPPAKAARLVIPGDAPPPNDGEDSWWDAFGGFFRDLFGGGMRGGGDPDYDMDEEGFLGPENRAVERIRIRAWRTLGYKSEVSTVRKTKRNGRTSFTSSRFVGGFIVGHAPDWNLQPNKLIFDFWNNYYNSSKPFDL